MKVSMVDFKKTDAVYNTLYGEISTKCPATIIRKNKDAVIYLEKGSSLRFFYLKL